MLTAKREQVRPAALFTEDEPQRYYADGRIPAKGDQVVGEVFDRNVRDIRIIRGIVEAIYPYRDSGNLKLEGRRAPVTIREFRVWEVVAVRKERLT